MNVRSAVITGIVLCVVFLFLQFLIHGVMLHGIYEQTASIWRSQSEMQSMMGIMIVGEIIFAFVFGLIYAAGYDRSKSSSGQGFRFGVLMALLIAPYSALSWFVILPIPVMLAAYWFVADAVTMIILGLVAGALYKANA